MQDSSGFGVFFFFCGGGGVAGLGIYNLLGRDAFNET